MANRLTFEEYLELSEKTLSSQFHIKPEETQKQRLLHGAMGLVDEAAEILNQFKKHTFYGADLDMVNIKEELGDVMRFLAIFCRELDLDLGELMHMNIEKLKKRYGEKFSSERALKRDTDNEVSHIDKK